MHAVHAQIPAPYVPYACTHARTHTRTYINALTHTHHTCPHARTQANITHTQPHTRARANSSTSILKVRNQIKEYTMEVRRYVDVRCVTHNNYHIYRLSIISPQRPLSLSLVSITGSHYCSMYNHCSQLIYKCRTMLPAY